MINVIYKLDKEHKSSISIITEDKNLPLTDNEIKLIVLKLYELSPESFDSVILKSDIVAELNREIISLESEIHDLKNANEEDDEYETDY